MVTQVTGVYADLYAWENLYSAWRKAARGKRGRGAAAAFEYRLEDNLLQLQEELATARYQPGAYASFTIHEPKRRLISAAPFRDRVVHHALCNVIEPAFERSFITHSYANRVGKGTHRALDQCQRWARRYPYVLQCDLRHFFPSIDHAILRRTLHRHIQDGDTRRLVDRILTSGVGVLAEEYEMVYFPGDDLFAVNRPRGLPIGNLTSQFWANCYLNPFDHFVTRELGCTAYLRYVDDFLLFADDKRTLWAWKRALVARLADLRLTLHAGSAQVKPVTQGIPFLGFVVYATHRLLKRRKGIAYRRRLHDLLRRYDGSVATRTLIEGSLRGWLNHVRYGDTWGLRRALLKAVKL
jgi:retron-type reverse transcriptase